MKLPIFHTSKKFETLFKEMGTEYSKINMNLWDTIEDSVLDEILKKGEVLIENEEIGNYLDGDGFFRVNNKTVLVYIKNQYLKYWGGEDGETNYRYHIYNCSTIRSSIEKGRKARYVFRDPVFIRDRGDDIFEINLTDMDSLDTIKTVKEKLKVCKNCLKETNFENYDHINRPSQNQIWESFNYKVFFEIHEIQRLALINFADYRTEQKNEYSKNFSEISNKYRESKNWTCEECGIDLSKINNRKYLHTHHINHKKSDNSLFNLKALCIECHSKKPHHDILKKNPDFFKFINLRDFM